MKRFVESTYCPKNTLRLFLCKGNPHVQRCFFFLLTKEHIARSRGLIGKMQLVTLEGLIPPGYQTYFSLTCLSFNGNSSKLQRDMIVGPGTDVTSEK